MGVTTLNLEVVPLEEVAETVSKAAGFVIGSPTLGGHMPTQVCACSCYWLLRHTLLIILSDARLVLGWQYV